MGDLNTFVTLLAVSALVLKLFVLLKAFEHRGNSVVFFCLTSVFCAMNFMSLLIVSNVNDIQSIQWALRPQYIFSLWAIILLCWYAFQAVYSTVRLTIVFSLLCLLGLAFSSAILFTDSIVSGLVSIGYSLTAVKGPFFNTFLILLALLFLTTTATLIYGTLKSSSQEHRNRCLWTLVSLLPIITVGPAIALFLHFEVPINGSGLIPIATSLFLLITLKTENLHRLTDVRRHLPFTAESRANKDFALLFTQYAFNQISHKEFKSQVSVLALKYKYGKSETVTELAEQIGLNRSTVSNLLSKHGLR